MKNFQDVMRENPTVVTQNTNTHKGGSDLLTRWYNMYWGTLTNTHMQLMDDGTYIVIGMGLTKSFWENIYYSHRLSNAPNTILPHSWSDVMILNHMEYTYTTYNGQFAVAIGRTNPDETGLKTIQIPQTTTITTPSFCQNCKLQDDM